MDDDVGYTFPRPLDDINQEFELLHIKHVAEEFIDLVKADEDFVQQLMEELPDVSKIPEFTYDTESTYDVNNLGFKHLAFLGISTEDPGGEVEYDPYEPILEILEIEVNKGKVKPSTPDYEKLRPHFGYVPAKTIDKTFSNTSQYATFSGREYMRTHYKSRNPALNIH